MSAPLAATAAAVDGLHAWLGVRVGWPEAHEAGGWVRCADVDAGFLSGWEARIDAYLARTYGRTHAQTRSGYALGWYAGVAGIVGGACFRQARRVPRLDRASLAFRCHADEEYPDAVALLDTRFWCLPGDPAAAHPDATVVADEDALAAVLRAQVRAHADDFLAAYAGGARLPRRHRLGAFFDSLDTGVWYGGDASVSAAGEVLGLGACVLPGATAEFADGSTVHRLVDRRGREHLSRRRVGCCFYFRVADDGRACSTCPRVDDATRAERYAELD